MTRWRLRLGMATVGGLRSPRTPTRQRRSRAALRPYERRGLPPSGTAYGSSRSGAKVGASSTSDVSLTTPPEMDSPQWLHGRLAAVATRCIGVDVLSDGASAMRERGFEVVLHDLSEGLGPLAPDAPFDVIVAGELIEHVEAVDMLFRAAGEALAPGGELLITTPNPYAPHRVCAAQLGIVWENVDHILYAFPSGMAELAERHGLVLAEAAVTDDRQRLSLVGRMRQLRRHLRGRHYVIVGYSTKGERRVRRVSDVGMQRVFRALWMQRRRFVGETFVYVVRRRPAAVTPGSAC